jgi:hypothetical protein
VTPYWQGLRTSFVVRDLPLRIADTAWQLTRSLFDDLVAIDRGVRFGVHADQRDDEQHAQAFAELVVARCRPGEIALSWPLIRSLSDAPWGEVEESQDVLHYPAGANGVLAGHIVERQSVPAIRRYVARTPDGPTDAEGFLRVDPLDRDVRCVGDLVRSPRALILGDPWIGKSWIARELARRLR